MPLIWALLEGRVCSETNARIALIKRYLDHFPATTIRMLPADREFTGAAWLKFLNDHNIPFAIRLKESLRVTTEDGHDLTLRARLHHARRSRTFRARIGASENAAASDAPLLHFAAKRLGDEWLIIATNVAPRAALEAYRKRWAIECLFGDTKTRGLNLEDTRLREPRKLGLLMPLLLSQSHGPGERLQIASGAGARRGRPMDITPKRGSASVSITSDIVSGQTRSRPSGLGSGLPQIQRKWPESCSVMFDVGLRQK
ncbi:transposase [Paracoccus sp. MBLB3053]|uniref:Transposase n=1 Tax=Paracoccus aurantius TaxID=3073814 RepID=A0ABU2HXH4_9RHOB|nr:transposase [Paracoccus sp. MBLB3053]MDS9469751.1 transposase [Paracoccus sp. MBLB3053]